MCCEEYELVSPLCFTITHQRVQLASHNVMLLPRYSNVITSKHCAWPEAERHTIRPIFLRRIALPDDVQHRYTGSCLLDVGQPRLIIRAPIVALL